MQRADDMRELKRTTVRERLEREKAEKAEREERALMLSFFQDEAQSPLSRAESHKKLYGQAATEQEHAFYG